MTRTSRAGWLFAVVVVVAVATVVLPWPLAVAVAGAPWAGPGELGESVRQGLLDDWTRGVTDPGSAASALADEAAFWRWFHAIKAVLAAGVLLASGALAVLAWRARTASAGQLLRLRWLLASAVGSGIVLVSSLLVIANVQGALAPLSSVLSFLPSTGSDPELARAVIALRGNLAGSVAATLVVEDFARYHAVVAVLLGIAAIAAVVVGARLLRGRAWLAGGVVVLVAVAFAVLTFANVGTALHPVPALDSFLRGVVT